MYWPQEGSKISDSLQAQAVPHTTHFFPPLTSVDAYKQEDTGAIPFFQSHTQINNRKHLLLL